MKCRDESEEVTPVPIPNTEVKLFSADGTWRETAWESRSSRLFFGKIQSWLSQTLEIEPEIFLLNYIQSD